MGKSLPVYRFIYGYVTTGILADETIEIEDTNEKDAHARARAKLDRNGLNQIGLQLLGTEPTNMRRSA